MANDVDSAFYSSQDANLLMASSGASIVDCLREACAIAQETQRAVVFVHSARPRIVHPDGRVQQYGYEEDFHG